MLALLSSVATLSGVRSLFALLFHAALICILLFMLPTYFSE